MLTTGAGSGKSLGYIVPIVHRMMRTGSGGGIQVIIVYPMDARSSLMLAYTEREASIRFGSVSVTFDGGCKTGAWSGQTRCWDRCPHT